MDLLDHVLSEFSSSPGAKPFDKWRFNVSSSLWPVAVWGLALDTKSVREITKILAALDVVVFYNAALKLTGTD